MQLRDFAVAHTGIYALYEIELSVAHDSVFTDLQICSLLFSSIESAGALYNPKLVKYEVEFG